jgi:hypothetical protein
MRLPGGEHAIVDIVKLRDCCLNPLHARGRHKARVFVAAPGLTRADAEFLRGELLRAAREADAVMGDVDQYGERYTRPSSAADQLFCNSRAPNRRPALSSRM